MRAEIGAARRVDRRRHGDDVEVGLRAAPPGRFVDERRMRQIRLFHFARAVDAGAQFLDALAIDIEADDRCARSRKSDRDRQTDIAEPDHGNLALMRHSKTSIWATRLAEHSLAARLAPQQRRQQP